MPRPLARAFAAVLAAAAVVLLASCTGRDDGLAPPVAELPAQTATASPAVRSALGTRTVIYPARAPAFEARPGASAHWGALGDAVYRIEIPDDWNGELVLFAHGVRLDQSEVYVSSPPSALRDAFLADGYAWAASSFSENFYAPGVAADDTVALLEHFAAEFGQPSRVYLAGESMGGHVTVLLMERYPELFDGALSLCGAVGGEEQIDYLVSWAMLAEYFSGVALPLGEGRVAMGLVVLDDIPAVLGNASSLTQAGLDFRSVLQGLTGGPRPFYVEGFAAQYAANFGLIMLDPDLETIAVRAATNAGVAYTVPDGSHIDAGALNAAVRRLEADPAFRDPAAQPGAVPTTGALRAPLLTLHTTGDMFVPIAQEVAYREKAAAAGAGDLLVQRAIRAPGHCDFSDVELVTAWSDLVAWVEDGERPDGDDLSGSLEDIGGTFTNR